MKLEEIGFYTLADERARTASAVSPLSRCELLLTKDCNFSCHYCRKLDGENIDYWEAALVVEQWADQGLKAIRFSGGEPTMWPGLARLVTYAKRRGVQRIAVSTNGSADTHQYARLMEAGVNDFSVSLDACCAADQEKMAGCCGAWEKVCRNIRFMARNCYTTVGIVLTEDNVDQAVDIIEFASSLGVADIRIIPAAQLGGWAGALTLGRWAGLLGLHGDLLEIHPILRYRVSSTRPVRGLSITDAFQCPLVLDDMAVWDGHHYPCIIYLREGGEPIGTTRGTLAEQRTQRRQWFLHHRTDQDPVCSNQCLDVCADYNRRWAELHKEGGAQ